MLAVFLIPVLYVIVEKLGGAERKRAGKAALVPAEEAHP